MAKTYYLPTVAALSVVTFTGFCRHTDDDFLAVEYLDYGVLGGLQITSLSPHPVTIERVLVNGEFHPFLHALRDNGTFLCIGFPRRLVRYGDSFITITDAAAAAAPIRSLCYGKPVEHVEISTCRGDFSFGIDGAIGKRLPLHGRLE